jgi:hypothetical protein
MGVPSLVEDGDTDRETKGKGFEFEQGKRGAVQNADF